MKASVEMSTTNITSSNEKDMFIYLPRNSANYNPPIITQRDTPITNDTPSGWSRNDGRGTSRSLWLVRSPLVTMLNVFRLFWNGKFATLQSLQRFCAAECPLKRNKLLPSLRAWRHGGKATLPGFPAGFDRSTRGRDMDVIPMCSIFQELQSVLDTGYLSALPSLEEYWQQVLLSLNNLFYLLNTLIKHRINKSKEAI